MLIFTLPSFIFYCLAYVFADSYTSYFANRQPNLKELNPFVRVCLKNRFTFTLWVGFKLVLGLMAFDYIQITILAGIYGSVLTVNNYKLVTSQQQTEVNENGLFD